jgi:hypothetical protein
LSDLRYQPEFARADLDETLAAARYPRAFDGDTAVRIILDDKDLAHVIVLQRWETESHDAAYQAWRAGPGPAHVGHPHRSR